MQMESPIAESSITLCEEGSVVNIPYERSSDVETETGRSRARTCDLSDVTRTLSQLSYSPKALAILLAYFLNSSDVLVANQASNSAFSNIPARLSPSRLRVISTNPSPVTSIKSADTRSFFSSTLSRSTTRCI